MQIKTEPVAAPKLVHPVFTSDQAVLIHQALIAFLNSPAEQLGVMNEAEEQAVRKQLSELTYFFDSVVGHPEKFGLRSVEDTKRIARTHRAALKGPSKAASLRNKRKARQEKRMATSKRRRKNRKAEAEAQVQAVQKYEAERVEAQEAYDAAKQKMIDRFEGLARKDTLTNEELQEVLELFGSPEAAVRVRELRAADDPQRRLDAASAAAADVGDEA